MLINTIQKVLFLILHSFEFIINVYNYLIKFSNYLYIVTPTI